MITIHKNRLVRVSHNNKREVVDDKLLFMFLDDAVTIADGVTLKRIIELLYTSRELTNIIFRSAMGGCDIEDFFKDMNRPPSKDRKRNYKKGYLEVYMYPEIWKFKKNKKRVEFNMHDSFHLIEGRTHYGISFSSLNDLKQYPVKIKLDVDFHLHDTTEKVTKESLQTPILKGRMNSISLYQLLRAITYEITWHGNPTDRDERVKELSERTYDLSNTMSFEELKKKLKAKKKKKPALRG